MSQHFADTCRTDSRATSVALAAPISILHELEARSASPFAGKTPFAGKKLAESRLQPEDFLETVDSEKQQLLPRALARLGELVASSSNNVGRTVDGIIGSLAESVPMVTMSRNNFGSTSEPSEARKLGTKRKKRYVPLAELSEEKREHLRKLAKIRQQRRDAKLKASDDAVQAQFKADARQRYIKFRESLKTDDKKRATHAENNRKAGRKHYRKQAAKAAWQANDEPLQVPGLKLKWSALPDDSLPRTYPSLQGHSQAGPAPINGNMRGPVAPIWLSNEAAEERPLFDLNLPPPGLDLDRSPA